MYLGDLSARNVAKFGTSCFLGGVAVFALVVELSGKTSSPLIMGLTSATLLGSSVISGIEFRRINAAVGAAGTQLPLVRVDEVSDLGELAES